MISLPGFLLFKDFCLNDVEEGVPQLKFYEEVRGVPQYISSGWIRLQ